MKLNKYNFVNTDKHAARRPRHVRSKIFAKQETTNDTNLVINNFFIRKWSWQNFQFHNIDTKYCSTSIFSKKKYKTTGLNLIFPVHEMVITYGQMHRTDKYSEHSSIMWPAWLNG